MNWSVIMAGGSGTRFWPLSTPTRPKQFLRLIGQQTPIGACVERLKRVVDSDKIIIVASRAHREALFEVLPDFPETQVLWEPVGRNTAPCIAWATETILRRDPDAVIGVFPSDHAITDVEAFARATRQAYDTAVGRIVLFGIAPTRPETGYGYIKMGTPVTECARNVSQFCEKPNLETAQMYLDSGEYVWNSGMFIYDAQTMMSEITAFLPQLAQDIKKLVDQPDLVEHDFARLISISIDYGVMEKTAKAAVMRAAFDWDDIGTWEAIRRYFDADANGNAACGDRVDVDSTATFSYADDGRIIATIGLNNVIIVSTKDAVLVMDGSRAQDVRKVSDQLKKS